MSARNSNWSRARACIDSSKTVQPPFPRGLVSARPPASRQPTQPQPGCCRRWTDSTRSRCRHGHPPVRARVVDLDATFGEQFLDVSVQCEATMIVPRHTPRRSAQLAVVTAATEPRRLPGRASTLSCPIDSLGVYSEVWRGAGLIG